LADIEQQIAKDGFWDAPEETKPILQERTTLSNKIEKFNKLANDLEENQILLDLAVEESDQDTLAEVSQHITKLDQRIAGLSLELMLAGEDDGKNAIVSINAGAGGTEAQDWAEMLFRMYTRWIERKGYKIELIDFQPGEEAGIKSVTFTASGENAYGYLKSEIGVHRLVRISPFNASGKRHTSFASVFVYPELDQEIVIDIEDKDLRIDVYRASGAGGQHQQEKSQHRNKDLALKVLKARLHQHEKQKQDEKLQEVHESKDDIAWGSQIRSYVLHPYQKVKDHRINMDIGNVNDVLDGGIDPFIEGVLLAKKHK
jgi:peptide chain release factor 2